MSQPTATHPSAAAADDPTALLLHRVLRHLPLPDHLKFLQACTSFRRILGSETSPAAACRVLRPAIEAAVGQARGSRDLEMRMLVRLMAIGTPVAAAVLTAAARVHTDLLACLCGVWRKGPDGGGRRPPTVLWECCNDELVAEVAGRSGKWMERSSSSKPDLGVHQVCATAPKMLCIFHRRWLENVLKFMFADPSYDFHGVDHKALTQLISLAFHCRNPRLIASPLLEKLERMGVVSARPLPHAPAFDDFPRPPPGGPAIPPPAETQPRVYLDYEAAADASRVEKARKLCLQHLWRGAIAQNWDELLDHLLLRYRLPMAMLNSFFREACSEGRIALALRIVEVHRAAVDPDEFENRALCLAIQERREEMVRLLLWIGRQGIERHSDGMNVDAPTVAPWLQVLRKHFEDAARRPAADPNILRITLSGLRVAAYHPTPLDPTYPRRHPLRLAASHGTVALLNLLAHAAGGWRVLSHNDNGTSSALILHHDIQLAGGSDHVLRGLEDLLLDACRNPDPTVARFLVSHMRTSLRTDPPDTSGDPESLFVTTLSECLVVACNAPNPDAALGVCRCLLFETEDAETAGPAGTGDLVASPALHNGRALSVAAERGHEAVVELLLADPRLPTAALYPTLVAACRVAHDGIVGRLLARRDMDLHDDPGMSYVQSLERDEMHTIIASGGGGAVGVGHPLLTAAIADGRVAVMRVLLEDPRVDAGGAMTALQLACASDNPDMVAAVLSAPRYMEAFKATLEGRETGSVDEDASVTHTETVQMLTRFVVEAVVGFRRRWLKEGPVAETAASANEKMEEERKMLGVFKRFLMSGLVDPEAMMEAVGKEALGKEWMDAVDVFVGNVELEEGGQAKRRVRFTAE
ncbi:hypothetical protein HDU96_010834 [Phlyctochytrium bullatum]|nr:hypothetical protein HDU96_010834 [Phlyctochytrium bullatum]